MGAKTIYACSNCGAQHPKWEGRCRDCNKWNTLSEQRLTPPPKGLAARRATGALVADGLDLGLGGASLTRPGLGASGPMTIEGSHLANEGPVSLDKCLYQVPFKRQKTGFVELDRVLGGGLVEGSYVLLGGAPGIGKSTLLMQMAGGLAMQNKSQSQSQSQNKDQDKDQDQDQDKSRERDNLSLTPYNHHKQSQRSQQPSPQNHKQSQLSQQTHQHRVLYISGEENVQQTALRARRLGVRSADIQVASCNQIESLFELVYRVKPKILVVDSVQTLYCAELNSAPGTVSQVRECAGQLMQLAKRYNICVILVGHVTKDGSLAGPKTLEHMVDTVLSFEGDHKQEFRLLRAQKNRFGSTNELGVFRMKEGGLEEVPNPSEIFLSQTHDHPIGSAVFSALEGTRPLLCEVQALTIFSPMPRCTCVGFDLQRANVLVAVLDKYLKLGLTRKDVFINVVGGLRLTEPAADLAVAAALISTTQDQALGNTCFFGELGLTGEVRAVPQADLRCQEALHLGFKNFVLPEAARPALKALQKKHPDVSFKYIKHVRQIVSVLDQKTRPQTSCHPPTYADA